MTTPLRILIFSAPWSDDLIIQPILLASGYDVAVVSQWKEVVAWITTNRSEGLVIIAEQASAQGLNYAVELRETYPTLPIILITQEINQSNLKQALELGLVDYLTMPVDGSTLLRATKRAQIRQQSLREQNLSIHVLSDHQDGIIFTDPEGHLLWINQSARNIFDLGDGRIEGKLVVEIFYHADFLEIFKPQNTYPYACEISIEEGRVFSAHASKVAEIGIAVIMQEITYLRELDRIKTDFVNNVSHDLRSPLTAVYGFVGLIDRVGPINEQQAEFIRHIQSSVQHITSLINDLMDLGRVEADYDIQMEDVNLKDIINLSLGNLDYQLNNKMQELEVNIPEQIPVILGNPIHLQRMVTNLIDNANKFAPPLGKIKVNCRIEAGQIVLEVADNGPGIPVADQPYIFDKFYRGGNLAQDVPGTGLGLSIVKSIVEKHRGRIWLESSQNGTTFSVLLPIK